LYVFSVLTCVSQEGDGGREGEGRKGRGKAREGRGERGGREGEAIVNWTPPATKTWRRASKELDTIYVTFTAV